MAAAHTVLCAPFKVSSPLSTSPEVAGHTRVPPPRNGAIAGSYLDPSFAWHAFVRSPQGGFTVFDPPGSVSNPRYVTGISLVGEVTGYYSDLSTSTTHGYIRSLLGTLSSFDVPGALSTSISSMNGLGSMTGSYYDVSGLHGFVRSPQGTVTTFDVPGGASTNAQSINDLGVVTGTYSDVSGNLFGFLRF